MKEKDIRSRVLQAYQFAVRGGLRASLFVDTPEEDLEMLRTVDVVSHVPRSQDNVILATIKEWRRENEFLAGLPDKP